MAIMACDYGEDLDGERELCARCGIQLARWSRAKHCKACVKLIDEEHDERRRSRRDAANRLRNHKIRRWWVDTAPDAVERAFVAELHLEVARAVRYVRIDS